MKIFFITLFPEMYANILNSSMLFKAQKIGAIEYQIIELRKYGIGPRQQVDDTPYGGGDGMLLKIEPLVDAIEYAKQQANRPKVLLMSARGKQFDQQIADSLSKSQNDLIFVCGRYEGVDERIMNWIDGSLSIGNYVLTGGELASMVITDAITRLLPQVLGGSNSAEIESHTQSGYLEYPQYTKPEVYKNLAVPSILLSGHHAEIEKWRQANSNQSLPYNI